MNNLLSVWLVPAENDEFYLSKIIADLGAKYNAPLFTPHLTLFGDIHIEPNKLKDILDEVFTDKNAFTIKKTKIEQSEAFFKTVFIEFELNEKLKNLYLTLAEKADKRDIAAFKPHISLIYKTMPKEEKSKIIKNLNIKNEFTINNVYVTAPKKGDEDFLNVNGWRIIYQKQLND